jgi:MSHA pilin protein MshC
MPSEFPTMPLAAGHRFHQPGFTLVEMVMTMVIVGILAAVVAPRFMDANVFQSRGFADQVRASLRYAQKVAIAQRRNVCAAFTLNSVTLTIASASGAGSPCDTALQSPVGDPAYVVTAPAGIAFTAVPAGFTFNALGRPSIAVTTTINVAGAADAITVQAETGYVQ